MTTTVLITMLEQYVQKGPGLWLPDIGNIIIILVQVVCVKELFTSVFALTVEHKTAQCFRCCTGRFPRFAHYMFTPHFVLQN